MNNETYTAGESAGNAILPIKRLEFVASINPGDSAPSFSLSLSGREAWALLNLIEAGAAGCTPLTTPGPRWAHYVYRLRKHGFIVETIYEPHGGAFPGTHARYVLRSHVVIEGGTLGAWRPNGVRYPAEAGAA